MLLHLFGNLFSVFWQYILITGANSHNFARKPQKVSISNAEKSQTPHLSVYSSFLFLYLFIEDQHMTYSSFAYVSIYTLKNAGLFFQPKCWVETAGLGRWVVLTHFWVENWSWS